MPRPGDGPGIFRQRGIERRHVFFAELDVLRRRREIDFFADVHVLRRQHARRRVQTPRIRRAEAFQRSRKRAFDEAEIAVARIICSIRQLAAPERELVFRFLHGVFGEGDVEFDEVAELEVSGNQRRVPALSRQLDVENVLVYVKRAEGIVQIKLKIFADFEISGNRRTLRERELHAARNRHCACSRQINRSEVFHVQIARVHRFRVGIRQIPEVDVVSGFVQVTELDAERDRRGRIFLGLNRAVIFEARGNAENRIIADPEIDVRAGHRSAVFDFRRSGKTSFKAEIVFIGIDRSRVHEFRVFAERNINVVGGRYAPIDDRSRIFKNRIPRKPKIDAADFPGGCVDEFRVPEKIVAHTLDVIVRHGGNHRFRRPCP